MQRRSFNWVVALIGLRGGPRRGERSDGARRQLRGEPLQLVVQGRAVDVILDGTFTSSAIRRSALKVARLSAQACAGPGIAAAPPRSPV